VLTEASIDRGGAVLAGGPSLATAPLDDATATTLATAFKALSDPVRLRLLSLIASHDAGEACVCDLTEAFAVSQPTISHHLKVLRQVGLVESERRGVWMYYRAVPAGLMLLSHFLRVAETSD
jgi:ArsR family transcriptional regulator